MLTIGKTYAFLTVTYYIVGVVAEVGPTHARLSQAATIGQAGRLGKFFKEGSYEECEPVPADTLVPIGGGTIISPWPHPIPTESK